MGKWGWKLFGRKVSRNIAVAAVARKLVVQVWHLLMGNPPRTLEGNRTLDLKFYRLAACRGEELRVQLALPKTLADCVSALKERITDPPLPSPA